MHPTVNSNRLLKAWSIAVCLSIFALPAPAQDSFGPRYLELIAARNALLLSAGNGTLPTDAQSIMLGAEIELGNLDAATVLLLYTDIACDHCEAALQALDEKIQHNVTFLESRRIIFRHSGSLLDSVIVACISEQSGARYASTFRFIRREKPAQWTDHNLESLMRLSGQVGESEKCLDTQILEKAYADFADLMSICDLTGCILAEESIDGVLQRAMYPSVPLLIVGHASTDLSRIEIEKILVGQNIAPFIDGL